MTPEQFDAVARVLPEALLLVTGEGRLLSANPAAAAMLDLPAEGLRGRLLADLVSDPAEKLAQYLGACARSRQLVLGSLSWRGRDGACPAYRAEGAVLRPWSPAEPALILLRLKPKETTSSRFILLNEKIEELSSEIHRRQQVEEELHTLNATLEERIE